MSRTDDRAPIKQMSTLAGLALLLASGLMLGLPALAAGQQAQCFDFVTGGGWLSPRSSSEPAATAHVNFGFNAGSRTPGGPLKGNFNLVDHNNGNHIEGKDVTSYTALSGDPDHCRVFGGPATINGATGHTYSVQVCDYGEPGRNDGIEVKVDGGVYASNHSTTCTPEPFCGSLNGGNIQLHGNACAPNVGSSCLATSALSALIQGSSVTAYIPLGSWQELTTGVKVVPLEPTPGSSTTVATAGPVNSCSSNNGTGTTVCTGNSNDVYVINGTTLSPTSPLTAHATATQVFSGGSCDTCGVLFDAATGLAWIEEGSSSTVGALEALNPTTSAFGPTIGLFGNKTSESISVDPVRHLLLSAGGGSMPLVEGSQFQIINTTTGAVYNGPSPSPFTGLELDSTAEDCSTGIALAPGEFSQSVAFVNLAGATFTSGSPGTWSAPTNVQNFSPDFANFFFGGPSGSAVAPGAHLAIVTDEAGGSAVGVLQLPSTIGTTDTPAATDWVSADVPSPDGVNPWMMGLDPHTVTVYVSPNNGKAYALLSNIARTFLVKIDMALLLTAPRLSGTHTANPSTIPAGTFTFIAQ